jgi:hypothetical protein
MAWAPDYGTSDEAKDFVRIDDGLDDDEIALIVTSVSRAIDQHTNRQFGLVDAAEQRFYTARWDYERAKWVVDIDDLMTALDLEVNVSGVGEITDYTLEPRNAPAKGKPWTRLVVDTSSAVMPTGEEFEIDSTGIWGWTTVPAAVRVAWRLQTNRILNRRDSPYGVAGSPQDGSEMRLLQRLDPDVAVSLDAGYVRSRAVG